jgi:hypothetical protein
MGRVWRAPRVRQAPGARVGTARPFVHALGPRRIEQHARVNGDDARNALATSIGRAIGVRGAGRRGANHQTVLVASANAPRTAIGVDTAWLVADVEMPSWSSCGGGRKAEDAKTSLADGTHASLARALVRGRPAENRDRRTRRSHLGRVEWARRGRAFAIRTIVTTAARARIGARGVPHRIVAAAGSLAGVGNSIIEGPLVDVAIGSLPLDRACFRTAIGTICIDAVRFGAVVVNTTDYIEHKDRHQTWRGAVHFHERVR